MAIDRECYRTPTKEEGEQFLVMAFYLNTNCIQVIIHHSQSARDIVNPFPEKTVGVVVS